MISGAVDDALAQLTELRSERIVQSRCFVLWTQSTVNENSFHLARGPCATASCRTSGSKVTASSVGLRTRARRFHREHLHAALIVTASRPRHVRPIVHDLS